MTLHAARDGICYRKAMQRGEERSDLHRQSFRSHKAGRCLRKRHARQFPVTDEGIREGRGRLRNVVKVRNWHGQHRREHGQERDLRPQPCRDFVTLRKAEDEIAVHLQTALSHPSARKRNVRIVKSGNASSISVRNRPASSFIVHDHEDTKRTKGLTKEELFLFFSLPSCASCLRGSSTSAYPTAHRAPVGAVAGVTGVPAVQRPAADVQATALPPADGPREAEAEEQPANQPPEDEEDGDTDQHRLWQDEWPREREERQDRREDREGEPAPEMGDVDPPYLRLCCRLLLLRHTRVLYRRVHPASGKYTVRRQCVRCEWRRRSVGCRAGRERATGCSIC